MSWAYVKEVVATSISADTNNQLAITVGTSVAQGNKAVLVAMRGLNADTISGVTDTQGNTWTVDNANGTSHNGLYAFGVASTVTTTALGAADVVTVTWTGGAAFNYFWGSITEYSGLDTGKDQTISATAFAGAGTDAITSGATGSTTADNELIFGVLVIDDDTETLTAGTTGPFTMRWQHGYASNTLLIGVEDKNGATQQAYTATGGWASGNQNELGICVTYKEGAGGSPATVTWVGYIG